MNLTDEKWAAIWADSIEGGALAFCRKCRRRKKLLYRTTQTHNGLTVSVPRRQCMACEPEEKGK